VAPLIKPSSLDGLNLRVAIRARGRRRSAAPARVVFVGASRQFAPAAAAFRRAGRRAPGVARNHAAPWALHKDARTRPTRVERRTSRASTPRHWLGPRSRVPGAA